MDSIPLLPSRPSPVRVRVFFDGQNLYHSAKECFGHTWPNSDPQKLAQAVTNLESNRKLVGVHFYTGLHQAQKNLFWHEFWNRKLLAMRHAGIQVQARPLQYIRERVEISAGQFKEIFVPHEKGIDLRIGIDLIRLALKNQYDTAIVFSQDSDLVEAVDEIREIRGEKGRWITIESAFPYPNPNKTKQRGIDRTKHVHIDKALYDSCLDPTDYRPSFIPRKQP